MTSQTQSIQKMKEHEHSLDQYLRYVRCYPTQTVNKVKHDVCQALYHNPFLVPGYAGLQQKHLKIHLF